MSKLSDEVRKAIRTCGISRYRIALETGLQQSVLSRFLAGADMRTDALDCIGDFLGLTIRMELPASTKRLVQSARRRPAAGEEG